MGMYPVGTNLEAGGIRRSATEVLRVEDETASLKWVISTREQLPIAMEISDWRGAHDRCGDVGGCRVAPVPPVQASRPGQRF